MKILVINGSPKGKRSNTYKLTSSFINGISETNEIEYEEIIVKDKNIGTCIGCFGCWNKTPGICVIKDDMKEILDKILWADIILECKNIEQACSGIGFYNSLIIQHQI